MINLQIETRHIKKVFTILPTTLKIYPNSKFSMRPKSKEKLIMLIVRGMFTLPKKGTKFNYEIMITKKLNTQVCSELLNLKTLKNSLVLKKWNYKIILNKVTAEIN